MFCKNLSTRVVRVDGENIRMTVTQRRIKTMIESHGEKRFIRYSEDEPIGPFQSRLACPSFFPPNVRARVENRNHPLFSFVWSPATVIALFQIGTTFDRDFYDDRYDRFTSFRSYHGAKRAKSVAEAVKPQTS